MDAALDSATPIVLIVDDNVMMQMVYASALGQAGYQTAVAADGVEAVEKFCELVPDLVLLDVIMPRKNGFEACLAIRAIPEGEHTPILMFTGTDNSETIRRAFDSGATDFVAKTINPDLLVHRVRSLLRNGQTLKRLQDDQDRLSRVQQIARLGDWEWVPESDAFWLSAEMGRIIGRSERLDSLGLENFLCAVSGEDREDVRQHLVRAVTCSAVCDFECRIRHENGEERLVWVYGRHDAGGLRKAPRLVGTLQDVTETRRDEVRSRMLVKAVDSLPIGITFSDSCGKILYLNPAEAQMHGYQVEELIGREVSGLAPNLYRNASPPENRSDWTVWRRESVNLKRSGEEFPVLLTSIQVMDNEQRHLGIITTCEDISEQKEAQEKLNRMAYTDPLTGLPNRSSLLEFLHQSLAQAQDNRGKVGLVFLDLDKFKDVNDTLGHAAGDKLLCDAARRLEGCIGATDILARLGGDEFVVLLPQIVDQSCVVAAVQRMLSIFDLPFQLNGCSVHSNASIGVALYPDDSDNAVGLFRCADAAMYHAKSEDLSHYSFFSAEMNEKLVRRVAFENGLRNAVEKQEFSLCYQPQWDLNTKKMIGAEALLRWNSKEFGLVPPSDFITVAEDAGLILSIGAWVLETACWEAVRLNEKRPDFKIAVNISGKQLKHHGFVTMLCDILRRTGLAPQCLELEFTESVVMENAESVVETLCKLKLLGVQLSIDDFGTGYSSLNYLKHFPVDRIKIDRSFITDVSHNNNDSTIVAAIVAMAHCLGLKVLAEGVETAEHLRSLKSLDCDEVQGFYLGRPVTAGGMYSLLDGVQNKRTGALAAVCDTGNRLLAPASSVPHRGVPPISCATT